MKTVLELLKLASESLEKKGVTRAKRAAEDLLSSVLKCKRLDLYLRYDQPVIDAEIDLFRDFVKRAMKFEPVEYILKEVEFFGCTLLVDQRVLIPRSETEILVSLISEKNPKGVLFDICCGSGAIGIALKKKHPDLTVFCSDISKEALDLAKENAKKNEVEISFLQGDLFAPFEGKKADFIVSNPPYISLEEYQLLEKGVRDFEPSLALVAKEEGLFFLQKISAPCQRVLKRGGRAFSGIELY